MTHRFSINRPVRGDILAREARGRARRASAERDATLAIEPVDMWAELDRHGYRLSQMLPANDDGVQSRPVRVRARHEGTCGDCGAPHEVDDPIVVTRGQPPQCIECGGAA